MRTVLGIDLSLNGTGLCLNHAHEGLREYFHLCKQPCVVQSGCLFVLLANKTGGDPEPKWDRIADTVAVMARHADVLCLENYAFGSSSNAVRGGELGGVVRLALFRQGRERPYLVAPNSLKKFATGKGNCDKNLILKEIYRRWGVDLADDNLADAYVLTRIGESLDTPEEELTKYQREVVKLVRKGVTK